MDTPPQSQSSTSMRYNLSLASSTRDRIQIRPYREVKQSTDNNDGWTLGSYINDRSGFADRLVRIQSQNLGQGGSGNSGVVMVVEEARGRMRRKVEPLVEVIVSGGGMK